MVRPTLCASRPLKDNTSPRSNQQNPRDNWPIRFNWIPSDSIEGASWISTEEVEKIVSYQAGSIKSRGRKSHTTVEIDADSHQRASHHDLAASSIPPRRIKSTLLHTPLDAANFTANHPVENLWQRFIFTVCRYS